MDTKLFIKNIFNKILPNFKKIIEKSEKYKKSILIYCEDGQNRSICAVVAFLMDRYNWNFFKSLEFLNNIQNNIEINKKNFAIIKRVSGEFSKNKKMSEKWFGEFYSENFYKEEEILITNTFLNSSKYIVEKNKKLLKTKKTMTKSSSLFFSKKKLLKVDLNEKKIKWEDLIKTEKRNSSLKKKNIIVPNKNVFKKKKKNLNKKNFNGLLSLKDFYKKDDFKPIQKEKKTLFIKLKKFSKKFKSEKNLLNPTKEIFNNFMRDPILKKKFKSADGMKSKKKNINRNIAKMRKRRTSSVKLKENDKKFISSFKINNLPDNYFSPDMKKYFLLKNPIFEDIVNKKL